MYRLLLVSDREEVRTMYERFSEWETLGFERPTVAKDAQSGIDSLSGGRFDAVSWLLSVPEGKRFFDYLSRQPEMLGMETARDEDRLRREIGTARRELSSRDAARQAKRVDDLTNALRWEFFYDLLRGTAYDREKIDERMSALKLTPLYDAARPVAAASFRLPQGDYFLSEVWRYGRERLENALKNIFESDYDDMRYVLFTVNPHHMRLLALPKCDMAREEVYAHMLAHLGKSAELLEQYFELTLDVKRTVPYDDLYELGQENAQRTAH